jgi:hypothetical protein
MQREPAVKTDAYLQEGRSQVFPINNQWVGRGMDGLQAR